MARAFSTVLFCLLMSVACAPLQVVECGEDTSPFPLRLRPWHEKIWLSFEIPIIAVHSILSDERVFYLWFYENTFFDAVNRSHADFHGDDPSILTVSNDGLYAEVVATDGRQVRVECSVVQDGVNLLLTVQNNTNYTWPEIAALTPCFFPGSPDPRFPDPPIDELFRDEERARTWFVGANGLLPLRNTDLHVNQKLGRGVADYCRGNECDPNWIIHGDAAAGLMLRESSDGRWVAGIAWEDFLFSQGHNPLCCMHLSPCIGVLDPGETRVLRGKIYLFEGTRADCLERFNRDFGGQ